MSKEYSNVLYLIIFPVYSGLLLYSEMVLYNILKQVILFPIFTVKFYVITHIYFI